MDSGRSMFILLPDCVTRRIDGLVSTLPNYEESIGQSRSDNGVVTGKTAGKQDKVEKKVVFLVVHRDSFNLPFPEGIPNPCRRSA